MRAVIFVIAVAGLCGCSQSDDARARADAERAKEQGREIARKAEVGAERASHDIDRGLDKTRNVVRRALDEPDHPAAGRRDRDTNQP